MWPSCPQACITPAFSDVYSAFVSSVIGSLVKKDSLLDIVYTLEYNRFGAQNSIQGKLKDLRLHP